MEPTMQELIEGSHDLMQYLAKNYGTQQHITYEVHRNGRGMFRKWNVPEKWGGWIKTEDAYDTLMGSYIKDIMQRNGEDYKAGTVTRTLPESFAFVFNIE